MSTPVVAGSTVAAAVLGSSLSAGSAIETARSTRGTAVAVAQELAKTGVSSTEFLVVVGLLVFFAGTLLVGLARRHGVRAVERRALIPQWRGRGVPLAT